MKQPIPIMFIRRSADNATSTNFRRFSAIPIDEYTFTDDKKRTLRVIPILPGQPASRAADQIKSLAPRKVFFELCPSRFKAVCLPEDYKAPKSRFSIFDVYKFRTDENTTPATVTPPRWDILRCVHGGLLSGELRPVAHACRESGSSICLVDRPASITRNRVGQECLHPLKLSLLFQYGCASLDARAQKGLSSLKKHLETVLPSISKILVDERAKYMTHRIDHELKPGESGVLVCSDFHADKVLRGFQKGGAGLQDLRPLVDKSAPVGGVLVIAYLGLPVSLASYFAYKSIFALLLNYAPGFLVLLSSLRNGEGLSGGQKAERKFANAVPQTWNELNLSPDGTANPGFIAEEK